MMRTKLFTVLVFAKLNTRRFFRDRIAIFFGIAFPLIFLFVFGGIFGRDTNNVSFRVALINQSSSQFAQSFEQQLREGDTFKIDKDATTLESAKEKMKRSQLDATLVLPPDFGEVKGTMPGGNVQVLYTQNNQQAGQTLASVLSIVVESINKQFVDTFQPFAVVPEQLNEKSLRTFDYTFAGLLGFSIIGLGVFGPVNVFPELKKQGILRRLHTTPLRVWQYFVSTAISQTAVGLVTMVVLFTAAILFFDLSVVGNYAELAIFLLLSIVTILGIGLALGGWAKNERQVAPLSNIVVFPMLFLSGTFFPRFIMPEWLQTISQFLPLTPVIDGVRLIATEGQGLLDIVPQLGLLAGWLVVIYLIAFRVFRWE